MPAFVQKIGSKQQDGSSSLAITVPAAGVAAGHTIVVVAMVENKNGTQSVTDSASNTYTVLTADNSGTNLRLVVAYCLSATALTSGQTITVTDSAANMEACEAFEYSGVASTGAVDGSFTSANGSSTSPSSGSLTTLNASDLLLGFLSTRGTSTPTLSAFGSFTDGGYIDASAANGEGCDEAYQVVSATGSYTFSCTLSASMPWVAGILALKGASGGGSVNGSSTATGAAGALGGLGGFTGLLEGLAGLASLHAASAATPSETVQGSGGLGTGFSGHGDLTASSAATPSDTLGGTAGLATGLSGSAAVSPVSAATPALTLTAGGGVGGGVAGHGDVAAAAAATPSETLTGTAGLSTGFSGMGLLQAASQALAQATATASGNLGAGFLGALGIVPAVAGTIGGAIHGAATALAQAALLMGFGGHGDASASSAGSTPATLTGTAGLAEGAAGSGSVAAQAAASTPATATGTASVGGGLSGSSRVTAPSAATPSLVMQAAAALQAGFAAAQALLSAAGTVTSPNVGLWRWAFQGLSQLLNFAFARPAQNTMVFGATQAITMSFTRVVPVATPNTTISVSMTATSPAGSPISNLATVTCTVTFPDGTTQAFSLGSGIVNAGSGVYTLTYNTKGPGENIEDWSSVDGAGNKCEYHNITPVSF